MHVNENTEVPPPPATVCGVFGVGPPHEPAEPLTVMADGVTPVPGKGPLVQGTDYSLVYNGAACELTFTTLNTAASVISENERLLITYRTQLVPYALVGVISPWNFPLTLSLIDAIPALLAGCAVLVKPSEVTPRFVAPVNESIRAVPELAAVLDMIPGDGRTGAALVGLVDVVCFTGSVATADAITLVEPVANTVAHYFFDRWWNRRARLMPVGVAS